VSAATMSLVRVSFIDFGGSPAVSAAGRTRFEFPAVAQYRGTIVLRPDRPDRSVDVTSRLAAFFRPRLVPDAPPWTA
jgi:hypothetical protein